MQEEELTNNVVYKSEVLEFVRASNEYCMLLEGLKKEEGKAFIDRSVILLSRIYSLMAAVEPLDSIYDEGSEKHVTELIWSEIDQKFSRILGSGNSYLRKAEEDEFDRSDLVIHSISEDLADIYQELKDFTVLYRVGIEEIMNDALWEVRENYFEHWGQKLLNCLGALHQLFVSRYDPEQPDSHDSKPGDSSSDDQDIFRNPGSINEEGS